MKVILLVVGKNTDPHFEASMMEYVKRIKRYVDFQVSVIPELKNAKNLSQEEQKAREAQPIIQSIQDSDHVILLDEHGVERRSTEFAQWLQKKMVAGYRRLVFVVGGPYGFASNIHQLAQEEISLSRMTFSHQMIRVLFTEQLYRAFTIFKGEPYHHE